MRQDGISRDQPIQGPSTRVAAEAPPALVTAQLQGNHRLTVAIVVGTSELGM